MGAIRALALTAILVAVTTPAGAQWLNIRHPRSHVWPMAKIDPAAPVPRAADGHPDLTGLWSFSVPPSLVGDIATDLKPDEVQPWAAALFAQRMSEFGKDNSSTIGCLPLGPRHVTGGGLRKIVQTPGLIVILHPDLTYRQICMDGRPLTDPNPRFMGYSVGRWEGDTLVVESSGFNDRTWLDIGGHPHTEALRTTERYRRTSFGKIERQVTLVDLVRSTRPSQSAPRWRWRRYRPARVRVQREPEGPRRCAPGGPNRRRAARRRGARVARQYVGVYELERTAGFGIRTIRSRVRAINCGSR